MSTTLARPRTQEIGTSYRGKEDPDALDDVLRTVLRRGGQRCGFEPCLCGRPFTATTMLEGSRGAFAFGAGELAGDLGDALALLGELGWTATERSPGDAGAVTGAPSTTLVGPVAVGARWALPESTLAGAGRSRYLIVERRLDGGALRCFDPMFGGFVTVTSAELTAVPAIAIGCGARPVRPAALARRALARGARLRQRLAAPTRDGYGLRVLAEHPTDWSAGTGGFRLRYGLRQMGLRLMQLTCLLGYAADVRPTALVLADLLYASVATCREAMSASLAGDGEAVRPHLLALAEQQDLLTTLLCA